MFEEKEEKMYLFRRVCFALAMLSFLAFAGCEDEPLGTLGESCENFSQCGAGLSCISQVCVKGTKALPQNDNVCQITYCVNDGDCLNDGYGCKAGKCTFQCKTDDDCAYSGNPVCLAGYCRECGYKSDCDNNQTCVDTTCYTNCESNNNCPSLYTCSTQSLCTWTGCLSDEECVYLENSSYARCSPNKTCEFICESDANCGGLALCVNGLCQDPGCTSDIECKAVVASSGYPLGIVDIACVAPSENEGPIYTQATGIAPSSSEEDDIGFLTEEGGEISDWEEGNGEAAEEGGEGADW